MLSHTIDHPKVLESPVFTSKIALSACILALGLSAPVRAQDEPQGADEQKSEEVAAAEARAARSEDAVQDDFHNRAANYQGQIVVTASGLKQFDLLAGTSVFEADDIQQNLAGQLGEVLLKLPGVSATSFSPGASRPVLRGFSGQRVRVLTDGLGTIDVSNTSADHANTIDPLTAERIEVLRGPAVMLYGSQAIGGAVNVIDKRIPRHVPQEGYHLDGLVAADTAYNLREGGASLDVPLNPQFVFHVNGSYRDTDNVELAGFAVAPQLREELLAVADGLEQGGATDEADALRAAANQQGTLPGSATRTWTANAGFAFFAGESNLGAAIGWYDTSYGVPVRPGGEEESVSIGLRQFRADLRGELALGSGFFEKFTTRIGYSDYTHTEFEGTEPGTIFDVQGVEARAELVQKPTGAWRGSIGGQYYFRDFLAQGDEAYVAPNMTEQFALFALQEFGEGPVELEAAARFESSTVDSQPLGLSRSFDTLSGALGLAYETGGLRMGVNLSRAERAPSAEELYSNGPHIATQAFEIGDPDLKSESAIGLEGFARGRLGKAQLSLAVYHSWFSDYVYQAETGEFEDGLPVFRNLQGDANYFGVEGEISYPLYEGDSIAVTGDLRGDYIRATLDDGSPIPRIPPMSLAGALELQTDPVDVRAELQWSAAQNRVAAFETTTDGFMLVNLSASWRPIPGDKSVTLMLGADNLFDVTGRRHASFTKDFVPLAGRNVKASLRFSF